MKKISEWFNEYGESHQNQTNKLIHWICIPLIFWSIIALLSLIPHQYLDVFNQPFLNGITHWGTVIIILGLIFYLRLSFNIFLGMLVFSLAILIDIYCTVYFFDLNHFWGLLDFLTLTGNWFLLYSAVIVFILAWILQFIGHKIEGKKPSFLKDIQFLLIGPAWLIGFIYDRLHIKY